MWWATRGNEDRTIQYIITFLLDPVQGQSMLCLTALAVDTIILSVRLHGPASAQTMLSLVLFQVHPRSYVLPQ